MKIILILTIILNLNTALGGIGTSIGGGSTNKAMMLTIEDIPEINIKDIYESNEILKDIDKKYLEEYMKNPVKRPF